LGASHGNRPLAELERYPYRGENHTMSCLGTVTSFVKRTT
jgi:hypothetical protein